MKKYACQNNVCHFMKSITSKNPSYTVATNLRHFLTRIKSLADPTVAIRRARHRVRRGKKIIESPRVGLEGSV